MTTFDLPASAADGILTVDDLAAEALNGESSVKNPLLSLQPVTKAEFSRSAFLAYLPGAFVAMRGSPRTPSRPPRVSPYGTPTKPPGGPKRSPSIKS